VRFFRKKGQKNKKKSVHHRVFFRPLLCRRSNQQHNPNPPCAAAILPRYQLVSLTNVLVARRRSPSCRRLCTALNGARFGAPREAPPKEAFGRACC
jgi:hypothetical protein